MDSGVVRKRRLYIVGLVVIVLYFFCGNQSVMARKDVYIQSNPQTYTIPNTNWQMDVPSDTCILKNDMRLYIQHGKQYISMFVVPSDGLNLQEIQQIHIQSLKQNLENYVAVHDIHSIHTDWMDIQDLKILTFTGIANCGKNQTYDTILKGYTFEVDGMVCTMIGSVVDINQNPQDMETLNLEMEKMIASLRKVKM